MWSVAGRYESWFLSARDVEPGRPPRALWIRHTSHRRGGRATRPPRALWCTVFDPAAGAPAAVKQSLPRRSRRRAPAPTASAARRGRAGGWREWNLALSGAGAPLRHLRPGALYRLPFPRTKLEAPVPDGIASRPARVRRRATSTSSAGARPSATTGAPSTPSAGSGCTPPASRTSPTRGWSSRSPASASAARCRRGSPTAPSPSAAGASGSAGSATSPACASSPAPAAWRRWSPASASTIRVAVHADLDQTVGFKYAGVTADPVRGEREVLHAGPRRGPPRRPPPRPQLGRAADEVGGAFELGGRDFTHGVPLQPYPDP